MPILRFTLNLEGVVRIHDAVLCLAKFSEIVSLEARKDRVGDDRQMDLYAEFPDTDNR